ncbi:DUF29 domain-containing protein [Aphanizomenon sp. CS-733/32]|uniref:DUF29 domain-containing protein n=1 Tax=Aphanizomenon sp. CS-733/32 TaxID=3021715 RepID=UPI00232C0864|nr:DUF29 domain-containing protein [Aphanizomenon sp. CS-733/32]MDB9308075.1 DUF29 domain-containing protein [Aphanizomenon sp. CS-733/32]
MQTQKAKESAVNLNDHLYETDFYAWTQQQANLLRYQQWNQVDLVNLIEEVESLGRKERQELRNRLSVLIGHLLKWEYQSSKRSRSWLATIRIQRRDIIKLLNENPSLQSSLEVALQEAYENARDLASGETNLPLLTFPPQCLYLWEDIINLNFYPGESANDDMMQ